MDPVGADADGFGGRGMTRRLLVILVLVVAAALVKRQVRAIDVTVAAPLGGLPVRLAEWQGYPAADYTADVVKALGVDEYLNRTYVAPGQREASLYVGYYRSQAHGASIHSPLNCLPGAGWEPEQVARVPFAGGTARQVLVRKGDRRFMVVYWYQTAGRIEGDEYRSRLYTAWDTIRYRRNDAALVRVMVPASGEPDDEARAAADAMALSRLLVPNITRVLFPDGPLTSTAHQPGAAGRS